MQYIPLEMASSDMVLAKEVRRADNPTGPPICGKGVELTDSLIARLKVMGVQHVCVEGHPVWNEGDRSLDEQLADLDRRFRKVTGDPLMSRLKELFRRQLMKSMGVKDES